MTQKERPFVPLSKYTAQDNDFFRTMIARLSAPSDSEQQRTTPTPPESVPSPVPPAAETIQFTPLPAELIRTLIGYQSKLNERMKQMDPLTPLPDYLIFDDMPVHTRLYSQEQGTEKTDLPYNTRFAELIAYRDPAANDLSAIMGSPVTASLRVGKFMDPATKAAFLEFERGHILGFDEETLYGIHPQGIAKFVALPWELNDPRPDRFPTLPQAHFVESPLVKEDITLMKDILGYFAYHLDQNQ